MNFESLPRISSQVSALMPLGLAAGFALMLGACQHCSKCTTFILALPYVDSQQTTQPVSIRVQPSNGASPTISCSWASSTWSGGDWTCTKDRDGTTSNHSGPRFYYDLTSPNTSWTVTMTGPNGTRTFTQTSAPGNVGDGVLPGDCQCDSYQIELSSDDLSSVGIITGTATGPYAGVDAG